MYRRTMYFISIVAALAGLLFGFDTGVISGAILFINKDFHLNHVQTEIVVSAVLLGAFCSAFLSGRLCDAIGRKKIIIATAITFIIGTLLCSLTSNISGLIIGRIILGIAIGIASYVAPLYLAEISPPKSRGMIVSLNQLAITIGILSSYLVNYTFATSESWRTMLLIGIVPALLLFIGMLVLPESPRYLILIGQLEKARSVFQSIRAHNNIEQEIQDVLINQQQSNIKHKDLFTNKHIKAVLFIGITLAVMQQITGINTIIYYAPTIFQLAGFKSTQAIFVTLIIGMVNVLFTLLALPLIDRIGRKTLLLFGVSGMCVSLFIIGHAFSSSELTDAMRYLTLACMMIYIACFAISLGPIVFVLLAEIFPLSIRGLGMSLSLSANWGANMIIAITFLSLIHTVGTANTFYLFAFISLLTLVFISLFIPETKGVSLELIEKNILAGNRRSWSQKPNPQTGE